MSEDYRSATWWVVTIMSILTIGCVAALIFSVVTVAGMEMGWW